MKSINKPLNILIILCLGLLLNTSLFAQTFKPSDLPYLKLWLAADTNIILTAGKVSEWRDLSGNNFHATQAIASKQPIKVNNVICGKPVIRFDGVDDFLKATFGQTFTQPNTIFIVKNSLANGTITIDGIDGSHRNIIQDINNKAGINAGYNLEYTKPTPYNCYTFFSGVYNGAVSKLFENSILKVAGDAGTQSLTGLTIGSSYLNTQFFQGDIAEIIFYNGLLLDSNRIKVEKYLMDKYSFSVNLGLDIHINYGFCGTVFLNASSCFSNYLWSTGATTSSIAVNQAGSYWVQATNCFGYISKDTIQVFMQDFNIADTTICFGDTISVSPNLQGHYTYLWNTSETTSQIKISHAGQYWVKVTDTTASHCFKIKTFNVIVDSLAYYVSLGNDTIHLCAGNFIGLTSGANLVTHYLWTPGGNTTPQKYITNSGWYSVLASDNYGCQAKDSTYVNVYGTAPHPNFSITNFCTNDTVYFHDLSSGIGGVSSWEWIIVGHDTSYLQNPTFVFNTAGTYTLKFKVGSPTGCFKDTSAQFTIHPSPVVNLGQDISICPQTSTILNAGQHSSYLWNTGDHTPQITATLPGIYSVTVTDANTCKDADSITIGLLPAPNVDLGDDILTCQFNGFWLNAGSGFSSYLWFNNLTSQSIYFSSLYSGSFNVWVTVSNTYGCLASDTIVITIETCPGINENESNCEVQIYPNPSNGLLFVELNGSFNNNCDVYVYNIQGQLIKKQYVTNITSNSVFELDMSKQGKGVYFVKFVNGENVSVKKIILN